MATLITPKRINDLKARVKAECARRAYSGSVTSYSGTSYDYTNTPATDKSIDQEHRTKIATPLNAINSSVITQANSGQSVISDADITAMEAFTTVLEKRAITDHAGSDCKSGCTGMCYGCQGTCYNACTGCTGCSGTCSGGCTSCSGCSGCGDACSSGCGTACGKGCAATCNNSCSGGCSGGCSGSCKGCSGCSGCGSACSNDCVQSCKGGNYS